MLEAINWFIISKLIYITTDSIYIYMSNMVIKIHFKQPSCSEEKSYQANQPAWPVFWPFFKNTFQEALFSSIISASDKFSFSHKWN